MLHIIEQENHTAAPSVANLHVTHSFKSIPNAKLPTAQPYNFKKQVGPLTSKTLTKWLKSYLVNVTPSSHVLNHANFYSCIIKLNCNWNMYYIRCQVINCELQFQLCSIIKMRVYGEVAIILYLLEIVRHFCPQVTNLCRMRVLRFSTIVVKCFHNLSFTRRHGEI